MRPEVERKTENPNDLSPQEFVKLIGENGPKQHLARLMPEFFWQQAAQGCSHFIIPTQMVGDRLINIIMEQPIQVNDETVSTKIRLSGILDERYNFVPLTKGGTGSTNWLSGFRSLSIDIGRREIEAELLTKEELEYLRKHAEFYQQVGNEAYAKQYPKIRPYLSNVEGKKGEFLFLCDIRLRPLRSEEKQQIANGIATEEDFLAERESIGISLKGWTPGAFKLIGKVSETVSIETRNAATLLELPATVSRGSWVYQRP